MRVYSKSAGGVIDAPATGGIPAPMDTGTTDSQTNPLNQLLLKAALSDPKHASWYSTIQGMQPKPKEKTQEQQAKDDAMKFADVAIKQLEDNYFGNKLHYGSGLKGFITDTVIPKIDRNHPYSVYADELQSVGPRLAKLAGDTGNIALAEQLKQLSSFPSARSDKKNAIKRFTDIRSKFGLPTRTYEKLDTYSPVGLGDLSKQFGGQ